MTEISRRALLAGIVAVPFTTALASCAEEKAMPIPLPTPSPTSAGPSIITSRPAVVTAYGPNGTHFPVATPWLGEAAEVELEAECSWDSIAYQVDSLTAEQVAAGAVVRVAPGTLIGRGDGSSRDPMLAELGDASWTRNVLICPRDGYGTVTVVEAGFRIDKCRRLSLFGFTGVDVGIVLTECSDMELGWGSWSSLGITRGGERIGLYELVLGFRRNPQDTFGIRPTDSNAMIDIQRHGCVFGPSVKPDGDKAHCDSLQLEGTGNGAFGPFLSYDCVDVGSSNAAVLLHTAVSRAEFHHSMILGEQVPWQLFPLEAGDYPGNPNAFAGGALDVQLYDSIVCGPIGRLGYTHVVNSVLSYAPQARQRPSVEGAWTVDPSISQWTAADVYGRMSTDLTPESLAGLWRW